MCCKTSRAGCAEHPHKVFCQCAIKLVKFVHALQNQLVYIFCMFALHRVTLNHLVVPGSAISVSYVHA